MESKEAKIFVQLDNKKYEDAKVEIIATIKALNDFREAMAEREIKTSMNNKELYKCLLTHPEALADEYGQSLDNYLDSLAPCLRDAHRDSIRRAKEEFRGMLKDLYSKIKPDAISRAIDYESKVNAMAWNDQKGSYEIDENKLKDTCSLFVSGESAEAFIKKVRQFEKIVREFNETCKELSGGRFTAISSYSDNSGLIQFDEFGNITTCYDILAHFRL